MKRKKGKALVIGAGIGGIRSALDLAESGYSVVLAEKSLHTGGILSQLDHQFPSDGCGMCRMLPMIERDESSQYCMRKDLSHKNIEIIKGVSFKDFKNDGGDFRVTFEKSCSSVDHNLCNGCGICESVCEAEISDSFNMNISKRKAVYRPVPHNPSNNYFIDLSVCTRCGECVKACPTGAISLPEEKRGSFKILVVDDEFIVRDSLKELLIDEGFAADTADSGEKALQMIKENSCNLLLVDIKMPGMDGVEVLTRAKELFPDLAIVMMTAYATIETAVTAMKTGALDYLMKPFDPEPFTKKILDIYQGLDFKEEVEIHADAVILATGCEYFNPVQSKNTYGYGILKDVITAREFERLISGTGPSCGSLLRQSDGGKVRKIAWFQCVGSRDVQTDSDFCSSVCCMYALKEARLAKEILGEDLDAAVFYMDMRAFGKSFYSYQNEAVEKYRIRFVRSRVHSVTESIDGGVEISHVDFSGNRIDERFDMIVLSAGMRPSKETEEIAKSAGLNLNRWGFFDPLPFTSSESNVPGIYYSGSATGLKDIGESVIQAGAASFHASEHIFNRGKSLLEEVTESLFMRELKMDESSVFIMICTCHGKNISESEKEIVKKALLIDPLVESVHFIDNLCKAGEWEIVGDKISKNRYINRVFIGSCLPFSSREKIGELSEKSAIPVELINISDIFSLGDDEKRISRIITGIKAGYSKLKRMRPVNAQFHGTTQRTLVIGGGIAGITAAKSIADLGYEAVLVEENQILGGNLNWLEKTIEGYDAGEILKRMTGSITGHPLIKIHTGSKITGSVGDAGNFFTNVYSKEKDTLETIEHGAVIIATGGREAETSSYGYGKLKNVLTQRDLSVCLDSEENYPSNLKSVVMIQCVDSREAGKKEYCSRICCMTALKNALLLKDKNTDLSVYIFYRDMMSPSFSESWFTMARNRGVIFIQYSTDRKPEVTEDNGKLRVKALEPVLGIDIEINCDLLVLSTGVQPSVSDELSEIFGFKKDRFGFFEAADSKFRPVDSLKEGIFACGMALSPKSITESMESAKACVRRALRITGERMVKSNIITASVHKSLCSLCGLCIEACPYQARKIDDDNCEIIINPLMCQGCGACASACPNSASYINGFMDQQMFDVIDSVF